MSNAFLPILQKQLEIKGISGTHMWIDQGDPGKYVSQCCFLVVFLLVGWSSQSKGSPGTLVLAPIQVKKQTAFQAEVAGHGLLSHVQAAISRPSTAVTAQSYHCGLPGALPPRAEHGSARLPRHC